VFEMCMHECAGQLEAQGAVGLTRAVNQHAAVVHIKQLPTVPVPSIGIAANGTFQVINSLETRFCAICNGAPS
jgi:hypothetical protein